MRRIMICLVRFYQKVISPYLPASCRYIPSCSNYAAECFHRFGCVRGFYLTFLRLLTCQQGSIGGYDPVPEVWDGWKESLLKRRKFFSSFHRKRRAVKKG